MLKKIWLTLCSVLAVGMMAFAASPVQAATLSGSHRVSEVFPDPVLAQTIAGWWTGGNVNGYIDQRDFDGYPFFMRMPNKGISSIEGIQYFKNAVGFDFSDNNIKDLSPLATAEFGKVGGLMLKGNQITSLEPLATAGLSSLTSLSLQNNQITSVKGIDGMKSLNTIFLEGNQLSSLEPFATADLPSLTSLYMENNQLNSLKGIEGLTTLQKLSIQDDNITGGNQVTDLTPLANLTNLEIIWAKDNEVQSLKPLANLTKLQEAYFEHGTATTPQSSIPDSIKLTSLEGMENKPNLIKFSAFSNNISDVTPLKDDSALQNLWLRFNDLTKIDVLNNMPNLIQFDATHNHISDISAVKFVHQDDPNPSLALSFQDITLPTHTYTTGTPLKIQNTITGLPAEGILPPAPYGDTPAFHDEIKRATGIDNLGPYIADPESPIKTLKSGSYDSTNHEVSFNLSTGAKKAFYTWNSNSNHDGEFSGIVTIPLKEEFSQTNLSWSSSTLERTNNVSKDYNDRAIDTQFYWKDVDPNKKLAFKLTDTNGQEVVPLTSVDTQDTEQYVAHDLQIPADKLTYGTQTFTVSVYDVTDGANHKVDSITLTVDVTGALRFVSAPTVLDGGENKIISGTIQKRLEKATDDAPLKVTDSRQTKAPWALGLQIDQPFTATDVLYNTQLPGIMNYLQNGVPTPVPDGNVMTQVYTQTTPINEQDVSASWDEKNGPAVIVPGTKVSATKYSATLTWTLMDTPLN